MSQTPAPLEQHPYTLQDGTPYSPADAAIIDRWVGDLRSGAVFARAAAGHRSRFGYQPPASASRYSALVVALGRLASEGDRSADVAHACLHRLPRYGTVAQQNAALFDALFEVTSEPWRDVAAATGPNAERPSAHLHAWTLSRMLHYYGRVMDMLEQPAGWCEAAARRVCLMPDR